MSIEDVANHELQAALEGRTIAEVTWHADEEDDLSWIGLTFTDGTEIELSAHGDHTEGWIDVEAGRRVRDIYGERAASFQESDPARRPS